MPSYLKKGRPPSLVIQARSRKLMHTVGTVVVRVFFRALHFLGACFVVFRANQSLAMSIGTYERRIAGFPSTEETSTALHVMETLLMVSLTTEMALTVNAHGLVHFTVPERC